MCWQNDGLSRFQGEILLEILAMQVHVISLL